MIYRYYLNLFLIIILGINFQLKCYAEESIFIQSQSGNNVKMYIDRITDNEVNFTLSLNKNGYHYVHSVVMDMQRKKYFIESTKRSLLSDKHQLNREYYRTIHTKMEQIPPKSVLESCYNYIKYNTKNDLKRFSSVDQDFFYTTVHKKIKKNWKPKYSQKNSNYLAVNVLITINKKGEIINTSFKKSWMDDYYKKEALGLKDVKFKNSISETLEKLQVLYELPYYYDDNAQVSFIITFVYNFQKNFFSGSYNRNNGIQIVKNSKSLL